MKRIELTIVFNAEDCVNYNLEKTMLALTGEGWEVVNTASRTVAGKLQMKSYDLERTIK
jgi:hypothetical protein